MITLFTKNALCIFALVLCYIVGSTYAMQVATTIPRKVENILKNVNESQIKDHLNNSRRIVVGSEALEGRPYMVYLKLPANSPKYKDYRSWLCGGVIIHEEYILTSAACIEDAKHFYIVSGTYIHDEEGDRHNNLCIKNGAKKAVWKCVPKNYIFDGHENDNIRWMNNDIAIVKTEDEFDFTRRIRGCEFIPRPICYNNQSQKLEEAGTMGSIAGWGSISRYNEPNENPKHQLLETMVRIISKKSCKKRWGKRYHQIIDNYMICTKDIVPDLSELCAEKYVDCTDIQYDDEDDEETRRFFDPEKLLLHSAYHNESTYQTSLRKEAQYSSGGFCENDHGGPLVIGSGGDSVVIGIISACLVKEGTNKCYGPFLYTSVWRNRMLINCAIYKDHAGSCNKLFRAGGTHTEVEMSWNDHPDGPAKSERNATVPKPLDEDSKYEDPKEEKSEKKEEVKAETKEEVKKAVIEEVKEAVIEEVKKEVKADRRQFDKLSNVTDATTPKIAFTTSVLDKAPEHSGLKPVSNSSQISKN